MSIGVWLGPQPVQDPSVLALRPWELPALTAPDEPPIFSSSRMDNLERSWAGLAGGGPSFSHSWIAAGREMGRNSETHPPNKYPGSTARQQESALHSGEAEGTPWRDSKAPFLCPVCSPERSGEWRLTATSAVPQQRGLPDPPHLAFYTLLPCFSFLLTALYYDPLSFTDYLFVSPPEHKPRGQ